MWHSRRVHGNVDPLQRLAVRLQVSRGVPGRNRPGDGLEYPSGLSGLPNCISGARLALSMHVLLTHGPDVII